MEIRSLPGPSSSHADPTGVRCRSTTVLCDRRDLHRTCISHCDSDRKHSLPPTHFSTFKKDLINRRRWPVKNEACSAIFEWIEVFSNQIRIQTTNGGYAPAEFESFRLSGSEGAA